MRITSFLLTLAVATSAAAQMPNWQASPLYGTITLSGGFAPDPHVSTVQAGGSTRNPVSGSGCTGYLNLNAPDLDLNYSSSGTLPLTISAHADQDVSLVVYTADGQWLCDDDSGEGLDPMITITSPRQGNYNVWVATYASGSTVSATVALSELGRDWRGTSSSAGTTSGGQMPNWQASPLYGTVTLTGGFSPDPHVSNVEAGGATANPVSGAGCTGFLNLNAPDLDLNYSSSGTLPLTISAHADRDISLVVYTPDGRWLCDDDSGDALDPMLTITSPRSGNYNVWVGTYASGSTVRATVGFSELGRTPVVGKTKG